MSEISKLRYFEPSEFKAASPSCSIFDMDKDFLFVLDCVRHAAGIPFHVNSAYRSPEHDKSKGRSGTGYHTKGRAVDIRCLDGVSRRKITVAALEFGLSVGIYSTFVHLDNRDEQIVFYGGY